jgi:hypothetical protein
LANVTAAGPLAESEVDWTQPTYLAGRRAGQKFLGQPVNLLLYRSDLDA